MQRHSRDACQVTFDPDVAGGGELKKSSHQPQYLTLIEEVQLPAKVFDIFNHQN